MLLSCGDALIDFLPSRTRDGREALLPAVGGSCLNVAIGLARLGAPTGFVGGLSTDLFGRMIEEHARTSGVDLRYTERSARPTTLAFVRTVDGEAHYAFYDENTASRCWTYRSQSIPFDGIEALHTGSTTLVHEATAAQTFALIEEARPRATISFDPNCRPNLVLDKADYRRRMARFAASADIVRLSDSDFAYLQDSDDFAGHAEELLARGVGLFVVTRGLRGVQAWHCNAGAISVAAPTVNVVDTIGAGDSFQAGLLFALNALGRIRRDDLARLDAGDLERVLAFAASCAAITCTRPGADPPRAAEVDAASLERHRLASTS
jgi:fructokinase